MTKRPLPIFLLFIALVIITIVSPSRAQNAKRDTSPIVPVIPTSDHSNPERVFLEHAERLMSKPNVDYQILVGDVQFRRGGMFMYCDSAHFSDVTGNFDAYGNVRMEQGDTLFIYADQLSYDDANKLAVLYADEGKIVRLINRDVTLETPIFNYDMGIELGYYENVGGKLFDSLNTLTSRNGEYNPSTKEAIFTNNVHLTSRDNNNGDTLDIYTHSLYYSTLTHLAKMDDESTVRNADGIIYTSQGEYNTDSMITRLYSRSTVVSMMESSRGTTLTADTIYFDRKLSRGEAFGNMIMTDTINKMILEGDYGYFDANIDSAFVTGRARVTQYRPVGNRDFNPDRVDTLYVNDVFTRSIETIYLHGDTIRAFRNIEQRIDTVYITTPAIPVATIDTALVRTPQLDVDTVKVVAPATLDTISPKPAAEQFSLREVPDTIRYIVAAPHVKFFRKDMQGLCDSLTFVSTDTMVYMDYNPVVWSENRQIFGDVIKIHLKEVVDEQSDSVKKSNMTLDRAFIPTGGFMAEYIEDGYYNQLSGKEMIATFKNGALSHLDVNGNVLAVYFPEESDSTINKVCNIESSFLAADFKNNTISYMKLWSETNTTYTPLYLAKKSLFFLQNFKWFGEFRPLNRDDIFDFPEDLQTLFNAARARGNSKSSQSKKSAIPTEMPAQQADLPAIK